MKRRRILRILLAWGAFVVPSAIHLFDRSDSDIYDREGGESTSSSSSSSPSSYRFDDELIQRRLRNAIGGPPSSDDDDEDHPFPHFFMHIPKTAGYYSFQKLMELLYHDNPSSSSSSNGTMGSLPREDQFRVCNIGNRALVRRPTHYRGIRCTMWMTERPYSPAAKHAYAVVRDPREHVLSQYFHCAESSDHARLSHLMPSLTSWLEHWAHYQWAGGVEKVLVGGGGHADRFGCKYSPVSMQSEFVGFDHPGNNASDVTVQRKFTVIGPMDRLDETICLIFVHYARRIPEACVCARGDDDDDDDDDDDGSGGESKAMPDPNDAQAETYLAYLGFVRADPRAREAARAAREAARFSHGVVHHGHSHDTTEYQDSLIRGLVERDRALYDYVRELFRRQVEAVERELDVTLCKRIRKME